MKYLSIALLLLSFSACTHTPKAQFACIHPAVYQGQVFTLPPDAVFTPRGQLVFRPSPGGPLVTLTGAICIKVENNE